jgi:hypothetical protein
MSVILVGDGALPLSPNRSAAAIRQIHYLAEDFAVQGVASLDQGEELAPTNLALKLTKDTRIITHPFRHWWSRCTRP